MSRIKSEKKNIYFSEKELLELGFNKIEDNSDESSPYYYFDYETKSHDLITDASDNNINEYYRVYIFNGREDIALSKNFVELYIKEFKNK